MKSMSIKTLAGVTALLLIFATTTAVQAGSWNGTIQLGGIVLDEEGDRSTVQETYNIYDGFNIGRFQLAGSPNPNHYFRLNLTDINLDSRRGDFLYRSPGHLQVKASYDQHRQVFDPVRTVNSDRKDWRLGAQLTPYKWLRLHGHYNHMTREGNRLAYPEPPEEPFGGAPGALGTEYDYTLRAGGAGLEVRKSGRGLALDYRRSEFDNDNNLDADRVGQVYSARVFAPCVLTHKLTHMVRASYGVSELPNRGDLDYTFSKFQYMGVLRPADRFQFNYNFTARRVENESTDLQTDRYQNILDAMYFHENGNVMLGYGYEMNDDDLHLTEYHSWRAGATFRNETFFSKIRYSGRVKEDTEDLTLLKDLESARLQADFEIRPAEDFELGAGFSQRERTFTDIGVESEGQTARFSGAYNVPRWGRLSATYSVSDEEYRDLAGNYDARTQVVTGRADFERVKNLKLSGGLSFLKADEDLDIEKSIVFFEGRYTVKENLHLEAKYNIYNYDDFILLDRYYTANVVWFGIAYDFHIE